MRYKIESSKVLGIVFELLVFGAISKTEYAKNVKKIVHTFRRKTKRESLQQTLDPMWLEKEKPK